MANVSARRPLLEPSLTQIWLCICIKSGSDENLRAETLAGYIGYQYLAEYIEEINRGNARLEYKNG